MNGSGVGKSLTRANPRLPPSDAPTYVPSTRGGRCAFALVQPRAVFDAYCPWRADWATFARIHPEAV